MRTIMPAEKHLLLFYAYLRNCQSSKTAPKKELLERWKLLLARIQETIRVLEVLHSE